jgi:hypothetical protein
LPRKIFSGNKILPIKYCPKSGSLNYATGPLGLVPGFALNKRNLIKFEKMVIFLN